jgi:hypothetical protein
VQFKAGLASTNWVNLSPDVIASGNTASYADHPGSAEQRYYRILLLGLAPPPQPVIKTLTGVGTPNVVMTWSAISSRVYRVQYKTNLATTTWNDLSPDVTATGTTASFTNPPTSGTQRY